MISRPVSLHVARQQRNRQQKNPTPLASLMLDNKLRPTLRLWPRPSCDRRSTQPFRRPRSRLLAPTNRWALPTSHAIPRKAKPQMRSRPRFVRLILEQNWLLERRPIERNDQNHCLKLLLPTGTLLRYRRSRPSQFPTATTRG